MTESETSNSVGQVTPLNSQGCCLSRERLGGERVGSKLWEGPRDATSKAKGGSCHWAWDLVEAPLPPGCGGLVFQAGAPLRGHWLPCPLDSAPPPQPLRTGCLPLASE